MVVDCFGCGKPASCAVEVTFCGQWFGDGFVCLSCSVGGAIEALREEHRTLLAHGVEPPLAEQMIRQRINGARPQA